MLWIIGDLEASWIPTGPNWSPMTRSVLVLGSHSCQDTVRRRRPSFYAMVTSTAPTRGRIITAPSKLASWALLWSGDRGPADPDRSGWERWRPTYDQWTLGWRQSNDVHRTERHGNNSWQWLEKVHSNMQYTNQNRLAAGDLRQTQLETHTAVKVRDD